MSFQFTFCILTTFVGNNNVKGQTVAQNQFAWYVHNSIMAKILELSFQNGII